MSAILNITKSVVNEVLTAISTVSAYILFNRGLNIAQNENKFSGTAIKKKIQEKATQHDPIHPKMHAVHCVLK